MEYLYLKRYIDYAGLKLIARNGTINHLIIARIGGNVIGMNFFGTYFLKKKGIFFGVGWWTVIAEQFRGKGVAPQLHNYRLKIMQRDSMLFGARRLDAIFIEVNDPSRVTSQLIAEDTESAINPFERMDFMMRRGFRPLKFRYMQPALAGGQPVDYIALMIQCFREDWMRQQSIPLEDFKAMMYIFVKLGFDRNPNSDPTYRLILKSIEDNSKDGYVKFG